MAVHKLLLCCCLLLSASASAEWFKATQAIMGTEVALDLWHENTAHASDCAYQVFDDMRRIDALMSPYIATSELSKINKQASDAPVKISAEMFGLIKESLKYSEFSSGAFDVTYASVGYLYDYKNRNRPSDEVIAQNLAAINYRHILLDDSQQTIRFLRQGVRIDLGGIAKGHAIDRAVVILTKCGIEHGFVHAGGDSYILGDRLGQPWMLGIKHPRQSDKTVVRLPLSNVAVSTSGDYERFFMEDGKRIHHILRPSTGKPVSETWSVTVLGDNATMTDALSTTMFVMGADAAMELAEKLKVDVIVIDAQGNMHYSSGLVPPDNMKH